MKFKSYYSNLRFEGISEGEVPAGLVKISAVKFEDLLGYDRQMFPAPRASFLKEWIKQPDSFAYAKLEAKQLRGYGVIRKCRQGYKIGPLFADDRPTAEKIFQALKASVPGETIYLDVPEPNKNAMEIAEKYGMTMVFKTIRMYNQEEPDIRLEGVYGVTSFELG
jgi:hypothetical protein